MLSSRLLRWAVIGTAVFTVSASLATIWQGAFTTLNTVVSFVLFGLGGVAFAIALFLATNRSRYETLSIFEIFFLVGAPAGLAWRFRTLLILISVIALSTSGIRLYTALAFGILTPVYVLGLMGIWGAKFGDFKRKIN